MWIKREDCEAVNLKYVQSIEKTENDEIDAYYIKFYQRGNNEVLYPFDDVEKRNEYYDALMNLIKSQEVPLLKI